MARAFNGSSDFIDCGAGSALSPASAITVLCWVKPSSFLNYLGIVVRSTFGALAAGDYNLYTKISGAIAVYTNQQAGIIDPSTNVMTAGVWNTCGFTCDTGSITAYVNGVPSGTLSNPEVFDQSNPSRFVIGNDYDNASKFFAGSIAEVGVWNVVLTAAEVAAFNAGMRANNIRTSSLVGYWPLLGLASPEPDRSGNTNNGVLTGTTLDASGPPLAPILANSAQLLFT